MIKSINEEKKLKRCKVREIIPTISDKASRSAAIAEAIINLPEFKCARSVFVYLSTPTEPDTAAIIASAQAAGKRIFVPRCRKDEPGMMDMVELTDSTVLVSGAYGIREPAASEPSAETSVDCIIVPCAAAGEDMSRLGHGAGYYDRFLAIHPAVKIMPCFDALVFPAVPRDSFDINPNIIVTETRIITERKI